MRILSVLLKFGSKQRPGGAIILGGTLEKAPVGKQRAAISNVSMPTVFKEVNLQVDASFY